MSAQSKAPRRWPLTVQLTATLFAVLFAIAGVVWVNALDVERQSLQRETVALKQGADEAARRVEERVGRLRAYVEQVATNPSILAAVQSPPTAGTDVLGRAEQWDADHPDIHALLVSVRDANASFRNVYLLNEDGVCISSSERGKQPAMVGRVYDYRPYFRAPVDSGTPFVSDVLKNATSPGTGIFVSAPIIIERKVRAVAVLKVDSHALHDIVADLSRQTGRSLLVDRFGVVVSDGANGEVQQIDKPESLQFRPLADVSRYLARFEETKRYGDPNGENYLPRVAEPLGLDKLWGELRSKASGAAEFDFPVGDRAEPTMVGYSPVWSSASDPYGYIVLAQPTAAFREPLLELGRDALIRFAGATAIILIVALWLIGRLCRRVQALARVAASAPPADPQPRSSDEARRASPSARVRRALAERLLRRVRTPLLGVHDELRAIEGAAAAELGERLADTIEQLDGTLVLAPGEPLLAIKRRPVELVPVLEAVAERARQSAKLHETDVSLDAEEVGEFSTDRPKLVFLLESVLDNACKFTRRGTVRISATRNADAIEIVVSDDGIGMTRRQLERVVEPFSDEGGDDPPALGVLIAIRTAELLGGTLAFTSEAGRGTTATFRLPLA